MSRDAAAAAAAGSGGGGEGESFALKCFYHTKGSRFMGELSIQQHNAAAHLQFKGQRGALRVAVASIYRTVVGSNGALELWTCHFKYFHFQLVSERSVKLLVERINAAQATSLSFSLHSAPSAAATSAVSGAGAASASGGVGGGGERKKTEQQSGEEEEDSDANCNANIDGEQNAAKGGGGGGWDDRVSGGESRAEGKRDTVQQEHEAVFQYDAVQEYRRCFGADMGTSSSAWRITTANASYELCDTYPYLLVVPNGVSDDVLGRVAKYRSKGRIPVLTWQYKATGFTLSRCSQPLVGLSSLMRNTRNQYDEQLIDTLRGGASNDVLYIFDARPTLNAQANKVMGGGVENIANYKSCKLISLGIDNIHKVRDSWSMLQRLCASVVRFEYTVGAELFAALPNSKTEPENLVPEEDGKFLHSLHQTQWLHHIQSILRGAMRICAVLSHKTKNTAKHNVLIHCSDGWDRTAQLTSLVQIVLDPYYRTMRGFLVLIEKEWISFGHKFASRNRIFANPAKDNSELSNTEFSPIFVQFLDCVWQICRRFPTAFEFNNALLIYLVDSTYLGTNKGREFGSLLFDSEHERLKRLVRHRTVPLAHHILLHKAKFLNPAFDAHNREKLLFQPTSWALRLWDSLYLRGV